jgi:hypothetical protein
MIDVQARRAELIESHGKLLEQLNQLTVAIERTRGAISICDELLAEPDPSTMPAPMPNGGDPADA